MHARARDRLVDVHQVFALTERVEEHGHRADVQPVRAQPQQMVQQARDLVEHHADVLCTNRHVDAEQLLDRHHVRVLVAHHRHVVQAVHVRHRLQERAGLGELLGRAVQQPDVRIRALDHLAIELEYKAQHAVGRRMLRPEIQRVVLDICHGAALDLSLRCLCTQKRRLALPATFFTSDRTKVGFHFCPLTFPVHIHLPE